MTFTIADLQQQLAIDKSALDDEVIRQPSLFYAVSEMLTEALAERDAAKEDLAVIDADLDAKHRKLLTKSGEKVTEKMVSNGVQMDAEHERAFDDWLRAKTRSDKLLALKEAFQQRSYMLRDLVSLYSTNYYETTSMKPTRLQEASHYGANRERIANAREARSKA